MLAGQSFEFVVVDRFGLFGHAVGHEIVGLARKIQRVAVRQVAAVRQIHSQDRVSWLEGGHIDCDVCLCAGMRLDVGMLGAEERLRAVDRELLGLIHEFAAAVVALAGITLGIFIREDRAHGFHHCLGNKILRWDQLEARGLPAELVTQHSRDGGIGFFQRTAHPAKFGRFMGHTCAHLNTRKRLRVTAPFANARARKQKSPAGAIFGHRPGRTALQDCDRL